jgi:hypothetical protein
LLFGQGGSDVEGIIHFYPFNTWNKDAHDGSGRPIAAFILAAMRIGGDYHQYGCADETATDNGVSHLHDRTPAKSSHIPLSWREENVFGLPSPIPAPSQPCPPAVSAPNQSHDQQQDHGADSGIDDRGNSAGAQMDAELGQEPAADKGAGNSDDEITDESEAGALHDLTCEPSGNEANQEYDQQAFARHVHLIRPKGRSEAGSDALPASSGATAPYRGFIQQDRRGEAAPAGSEITYGSSYRERKSTEGRFWLVPLSRQRQAGQRGE